MWAREEFIIHLIIIINNDYFMKKFMLTNATFIFLLKAVILQTTVIFKK